jgi:hypothetical protein
MKSFPFPFLGHGIGDRSTFKLYVFFVHPCVSTLRKKTKLALDHHSKLFQLQANWSENGLQLLPTVPRINSWLNLIDGYEKAYRMSQKIKPASIYKWDPRVDYSNPEMVSSFNFDWSETKPQDRLRLLLNFGIECLLRDIHFISPIRLVFYRQGKISFDTSWSRWTEAQLPMVFQEIAQGELTFPLENHARHHFLGDFFSSYLTQDNLVRLEQSTREELFDLFLKACYGQPDCYDMKWLMRLNGGDEITILSKLSRKEIKAIIKDYLIMKKVIKGAYRATAYEPGERGMKWLLEAFGEDFRELTAGQAFQLP